MKESIQRAYAYMMGQKVKMGIGQQIDTTDFHVEAIDLLSNHVPCEAGMALVVAVYSAIKKSSVLAGLVILGDISIQGNIKSLRSLAEGFRRHYGELAIQLGFTLPADWQDKSPTIPIEEWGPKLDAFTAGLTRLLKLESTTSP